MSNEHHSTPNILPFDGQTIYYGIVFPKNSSDKYFSRLMESIEWKNDEAKIFGKHFITKRKAAWYGDSAFSYTYSNTTKHALPWTIELVEIKSVVEKITGKTFNSCLLNLYHSGDEGMGWHSDDERALGRDTAIASVSFGAERKFMLKHKKSKESVAISLQNGSVLIMTGTTQTHWLHSLPKTKKVSEPRINLTFRTIIV